MINVKRGAGVWFAYDLIATSPTGKKYRQGYYDDEYDVALIDADTLKKLGYSDVAIVEREWHKNKRRSY